MATMAVLKVHACYAWLDRTCCAYIKYLIQTTYQYPFFVLRKNSVIPVVTDIQWNESEKCVFEYQWYIATAVDAAPRIYLQQIENDNHCWVVHSHWNLKFAVTRILFAFAHRTRKIWKFSGWYVITPHRIQGMHSVMKFIQIFEIITSEIGMGTWIDQSVAKLHRDNVSWEHLSKHSACRLNRGKNFGCSW